MKPSKEVGSSIHQFQYNPNGTLFVNLDYSDSDWKELCKNDVLLFQPAPALYEGPLLISYAKWKDLQEIKKTIPEDCHSFYELIAHHPQPPKKSTSKILQ